MIRHIILKELKEHGFGSSKITGTHPGHTIPAQGFQLEFDHTDYENFRLGSVGYSDNKIHQLIRGYLQRDKLEEWVADLLGREKKDTDVMFFPSGSHGHERGPCITAIGFRDPDRDVPTLTVFSRASEFPHRFLADLWLITGLANYLKQKGVIQRDLPIHIRWFISLVWMDCRVANYLRIMEDPIQPPYASDPKFNFRVEQQWNDYITADRPVTYATLRNLKALWKGDKATSQAVPADFIKYLERP